MRRRKAAFKNSKNPLLILFGNPHSEIAHTELCLTLLHGNSHFDGAIESEMSGIAQENTQELIDAITIPKSENGFIGLHRNGKPRIGRTGSEERHFHANRF